MKTKNQNTMLRNLVLYCLIMFPLFFGCVKPQLSPMQKRQMTTKLFEGAYETVYRSMITVLQDQGYIINNTDMQTGLISANLDKEVGTGYQIFQALAAGAVYDKGSEIALSIMTNKISASQIEVRMNIQEAKYGQTSTFSATSKKSVKQILDPEIYHNLFNQIQIEISRRQAMQKD